MLSPYCALLYSRRFLEQIYSVQFVYIFVISSLSVQPRLAFEKSEPDGFPFSTGQRFI